MKALFAASVLVLAALPALAAEPDGLTLPSGFHASVVAEGLGPVRHLAFRPNGDLFLSTPRARTGLGGGIIALHLDADHKVSGEPKHFGAVDGGTGIGFYRGALYAATPSRIYRYNFKGNALLPDPEPQVVVDGMPATGNANRGIAFDDKGGIFVGVTATAADACNVPAPRGTTPVGVRPCKDLEGRSGIWRFSATRLNQNFADGERIATGFRDSTALAWLGGGLYGFFHGTDGTSRAFPKLVTPAEDAQIADELIHLTKGTDIGWPYTYYDGVRKMRMTTPEFGGDGKTAASGGNYAVPVLTFQAGRVAPLDLVAYNGTQFPAEYRGGAFVPTHGTGGQVANGHNGYNVYFVPVSKDGQVGEPKIFADGFADSNSAGGKAKYRPVGAAVAPDGSLYVAESNKGRVWRITYGDAK